MMTSQLVSVIIPCYNAEKYIQECIQSVLEQTHKHIEIIVVDNNSSDSSMSIVNELAKNNPNKIILLKEPQAGGSYARNTGFNASKGAFIQFLDADDIIVPNKIEQQLVAFSEGVDVVVSDYGIYSKDFSHQTELRTFEQVESNPLQTAINSIIITGNPLYRKTIIEKHGCYDVSLSSSQDWEFHIRLALNGAKFKYLSGEFFHYRKHNESLSSNWVKVYKVAIQIIERNKDQIKSSSMYTTLVGKHIASVYYLTFVHGGDVSLTETIKEINCWDKKRLDFIANPIKKFFAKIFSLKHLLRIERLIHSKG
jgi:glycosyltransferase involved in cell wall biosynthesis